MKTIRKFFAAAAITGAFLVGLITMSTGTANADTVNWDAVAQCESGGNWSTNSGNGFYGGLQFSPATWASNGGIGSPQDASRDEQIRVAQNVAAKQGMGAWPKCGSAAGGVPSVIPALWKPGMFLHKAINGISDIISLIPHP
jgi:hypothetical protein